jgi:RNA polymerase sigma factor (sigma-70 family)
MPRTAPHTQQQICEVPTPRSGWGHDQLERHVARHDRRLRAVARSYGLTGWDVDDVVQSTWLQYLEHGDALRDPAALGAWLETTARRLCLRLLQRHVREQLTDECDPRTASADLGPEHAVLARECRVTVRHAIGALPDRQRRLIALLVGRPDLSYEEVGRRLAMPIGSIGPTRARCLDRLRRDRGLRALATT